MTREDALWVAIKLLGLYFVVHGLMNAIGYVVARATSMGIRGAGGALMISAFLLMAVGAYLFVDGEAVLSLATRREAGGASGSGEGAS